jgi:hypothetical protein
MITSMEALIRERDANPAPSRVTVGRRKLGRGGATIRRGICTPVGMTEPRQTPAPHAGENDSVDDTARPRRRDRDHADLEQPPAVEPAADDQAIDTAGTPADPDRPTPKGDGF